MGYHQVPRCHEEEAVKRGRSAILLSVAVLLAGFFLWKGLSNATVYFKTVPEAIAERAQLGSRRFRLEGLVKAGSVKGDDKAVRFVVEEDGQEISVLHTGSPPELFKANIPVVLEGHFEGNEFKSDRILVKHTEEYRKDNPDRVEDFVGQ